MSNKYLSSFTDQESALSYTGGGGETLLSPQVSLIGADEVVYSKEIPHESKIKFAKDEETGKLYFVVDGVYYDALTLKKTNIPVITYAGVDLGLPSGTIWADRNVGAETPQDNGLYFSCGSTSGVSIIGTDKWHEDDIIRIILIQNGTPAETITQEMIDNIKLEAGENLKTEIEGYLKQYSLIIGTMFIWETAPYYSGVSDDNRHLFSKYNGTDGLTVLEASDDAATVNMGEEWRMPTSAETVELVENTDQYYIDLSGHTVAKSELDGSKLRSICFVKKGEAFDYNNRTNFIEFPFAGNCGGSLFGGEGSYGGVWSSSVDGGIAGNARYLYFYSDGDLVGVSNYDRCLGLSVRGVRA